MTGSVLAWFVLLRDLSVKSALFLLAAWALTLGMRRASAAARHLVWLLTFGGLLLLPLLSVTLPPRSVLILPARSAPLLPQPAVPPVLSAVATPPVFTAAPSAGVLAQQPTLPRPVASTPARAQPPVMSAWPRWVCRTWLLGTLLVALPLIGGWLLAVQRIRRCAPVTDPATLAFATEAARQLGLHRPILLRSGPSVAVPVTFGLLRPVVLLPDGAASWPTERLRVALLHELAHIRRGDWAVQTAARLVCALFWHNPLVWPAARMLRAEAERACDDLVLSSGIPAPDYAQHLLAVAAALSGANRPLPLAVPMAGLGPLESRLRAVLATRPRRAPSRRLAALAFLTALVVLVPLAALRPAARAARRTAPPSPIVVAVLLAPPRAVRSAPVWPSVPILSPPKGVPPMKPPMPVKTAALAAFAAGLALPTAQAKPTVLVGHPPAPTLANTRQIEAVLKDLNARTKAGVPAAPAADALHWNKIFVQHAALKTIMASTPWAQGKNPDGVKRMFFLMGDNSILVDATPAGLAQVQEVVKRLDVAPGATLFTPSPPHDKALINFATQGDVTSGVGMLFQGSHRNYVIEPGVSGSVKLDLHGVPFDKALSTLVGANSEPLEWSVQDGVYHIRPRAIIPTAVINVRVSGDPIGVSNPSVSLDLKKVPIRQALDSLFTAAKANYTVAPGVPDDNDTVTVHLTNVPFVQALYAVLAASATPLVFTVQDGGIFAVTPVHPFPFGIRSTPARPGNGANPFAPSLLPNMRFAKPDAAKSP
jgi:beta-lactamase regulating signal transducer with metallopeptidase domain